jgi:hypothetical protein
MTISSRPFLACFGGYKINVFQVAKVRPLANDTDTNIIRENMRLIQILSENNG